MILLSMLRASDELIARGRAFKDSSAGRSAAERMEQLYRTQVVVDEATDFSPLQLACMATLSHPATRSFFACGDFNQRVTNWGARTQADVRWAIPNIDARTVTVAYRQSRHLHELARSIAQLTGGDVAGASLPDFVDNDGLPPVLATDLNDADSIAAWLSRRIEEIDGALQGELPSIAVLVNSEDEVRTVARSLEAALTAQNIPVVACTDGQVAVAMAPSGCSTWSISKAWNSRPSFLSESTSSQNSDPMSSTSSSMSARRGQRHTLGWPANTIYPIYYRRFDRALSRRGRRLRIFQSVQTNFNVCRPILTPTSKIRRPLVTRLLTRLSDRHPKGEDPPVRRGFARAAPRARADRRRQILSQPTFSTHPITGSIGTIPRTTGLTSKVLYQSLSH